MTRILTFDTETTGVDPHEDRIVTAFVGLYDSELDAFTTGRSWLIRPTAKPISEQASSVNGITNEYALTHGEDADVAIPDIALTLRALSDEHDIPICAFNATFDLTILSAELTRYGGDRDTLPTPLNVLDPLIIDRAKDRFRRGTRRLVDMAPVYGVPVEEDAHTAEADCLMTARLAAAQLARYHLIGDAVSWDHLTVLQAQWHAVWADGFETFLRGHGTPDARISRAFPIADPEPTM